MIFKIKKIHPKAKTPKYALGGDAGLDLFSVENVLIKSGEIAEVHTGIQIELPSGTVGLVWDKSGLATKHGIKVMGGVWDEIYHGELIISLINLSKTIHKVEIGDKIAQILIQKIEHPEIKEVDKIKDSVRGNRRLGSTGNI